MIPEYVRLLSEQCDTLLLNILTCSKCLPVLYFHSNIQVQLTPHFPNSVVPYQAFWLFLNSNKQISHLEQIEVFHQFFGQVHNNLQKKGKA